MTKLSESMINKINSVKAEKIGYYIGFTASFFAAAYAGYLGCQYLNKQGYGVDSATKAISDGKQGFLGLLGMSSKVQGDDHDDAA